MRQGMRNLLALTVKDKDGQLIDLTKFKNFVFYIKQRGYTWTFGGSVSINSKSTLIVDISKIYAMEFEKGLCRWQLCMTETLTGAVRTHDPVEARMGELLGENGYGD